MVTWSHSFQKKNSFVSVTAASLLSPSGKNLSQKKTLEVVFKIGLKLNNAKFETK